MILSFLKCNVIIIDEQIGVIVVTNASKPDHAKQFSPKSRFAFPYIIKYIGRAKKIIQKHTGTAINKTVSKQSRIFFRYCTILLLSKAIVIYGTIPAENPTPNTCGIEVNLLH